MIGVSALERSKTCDLRAVSRIVTSLWLIVCTSLAFGGYFGPDHSGYYGFNQEHGCNYQFVDISSGGNFFGNGVTGQGNRVLGISNFSLYGSPVSQLAVNVNGFLTSETGGASGSDILNNCPLPQDVNAGNGDRLYVLHDDLSTSLYHQSFTSCPRPDDFYQENGPCDIFQWEGSYIATGGSVIVQAILYEGSNEIVYQYQAATETGGSSTTGVQKNGYQDGLLYACNTENSIIPGETAICLFPPQVLSGCAGPAASYSDVRFMPFSNESCGATEITTGTDPVVVEPNSVVNFRAGKTTINPPFVVRRGGVFTVGTLPATCSSGNDADNDRLDDCVETNRGVFVGPNDTGTDPNNADTDGDGIEDGDEVLGTLAGLNLPGMGVHPLRKNLLIEYDWFDDSLECASHSHRPTAAMMEMVKQAFASAPVTNPDGTTGIVVIQDYGQGGVFTGGNLINDADGVLTGGVSGTEFSNHRSANFAANRNGYFRYVILPHRYNTSSNSSGQANLPGDNMIVSLYCTGTTSRVANTIMHEVGHNLGLRHGGYENANDKPNYNSVMNYLYQFPGVDGNCTPPGNGLLDYSDGDRLTLDETNLDENEGICGTKSWDWNDNGSIESGISHDLNPGESGGAPSLYTLEDYNDWANLNFAGLSNRDGSARFPDAEIISCEAPSRPDRPDFRPLADELPGGRLEVLGFQNVLSFPAAFHLNQ